MAAITPEDNPSAKLESEPTRELKDEFAWLELVPSSLGFTMVDVVGETPAALVMGVLLPIVVV